MGPDGMAVMSEPRWIGRPPRATVEAFPEDLPRLNAVVADLNATRPGRWRQKDAIRYLLDFREDAISALQDAREVAP